MFCDEAILRVYLGQDEYESRKGAGSFLDCYHELAYHVTEGHRIVLETENWVISLDVNGILKEPKASFCRRPGEYLQDGVEVVHSHNETYIHFENTLFVGERLLEVAEEGARYLCRFDHFCIKVIPYKLGTMNMSLRNRNHFSYNHILGCDHHITTTCKCGGNGEILLDFVSDYIVRCRNCKKSTYANMELQAAINDWNDGKLECVVDGIIIE